MNAYQRSAYLVAQLPKKMLMSHWAWLDLCATRREFSGVWAVSISKERYGDFSLPFWSNTKGQRRIGFMGEKKVNFAPWEQELIEWLNTHVKKRIFVTTQDVFYFEDPKEAMLFKLTWA